MRNIQSVPSTDSRFIQLVEKIFEELRSTSQMWFTPGKEVGCTMEAVAHASMYYFFKAYVVFITKQVYSKVRKYIHNITNLERLHRETSLFLAPFPATFCSPRSHFFSLRLLYLPTSHPDSFRSFIL